MTVNVALCNDGDFDGGKLLTLCGRQIRRIDRREGEATVHASTLLHGVSRLRAGRRYSLILFYGRKAQQRGWAETTRLAETSTLAELLRDTSRCDSIMPVGSFAHPALDLLLRGDDEKGPSYVGVLIEAVVARYDAPHLLPSSIERRRVESASNGWCYSLRALVAYMGALLVESGGPDQP